jgi:hypothetical protein
MSQACGKHHLAIQSKFRWPQLLCSCCSLLHLLLAQFCSCPLGEAPQQLSHIPILQTATSRFPLPPLPTPQHRMLILQHCPIGCIQSAALLSHKAITVDSSIHIVLLHRAICIELTSTSLGPALGAA